MLSLETEVLRLTNALDAYKTVPNKARGWQYAEVKSVADNTDWNDRFQSHQGLTMLFLFVTMLRVSEATHVRIADVTQ